MMAARRAGAVLALAFLSACRSGREAPVSPLDLLGMNYVIVAAEGEGGSLAPEIALGGDERPVLAATTPSEFRYQMRVPPNGFLTFLIGIGDNPLARGDETLPGSQVRFRVRAGESQPDRVLFERNIHVSRRGRWLPQSVDLKAFAGREIRLVLETSIAGHEGHTGPFPIVGLFAEPILHDRGAYRRARGVVLISIDTLRRDHVSLYGYPRRTTPGLEALAREAVTFDDAVSTSSWTLPAHASLFTSTLPSVHGATTSKVGLSPEWPGLPRVLRDSGYFTEAITTHLYLSKEYGFGEGFDRHRYLPETRASEVTNHAIHFLEARGDSDFFLFVHYYDPHWHYDPPHPFDRAFDPAYQGKATGIWWDFKELTKETIDPRDLHHIEALYDGEILYTDREVERLVSEMKRLGLFENALLVVTSDHGEEFLDHGQWEHQKTLYEEQLRIPLLVKFPKGAAAGRRVEGQVSLIDVAPTMLDALGIPAPPTFAGKSLQSAVRDDDAWKEDAWAETEHTLDGSRKLALRRGISEEKAIFTLREEGVAVELFDLAEDGNEKNPLDPRGRRIDLERRLRTYLLEAESLRRGKTLPQVLLRPEDLERLRSLGYLR